MHTLANAHGNRRATTTLRWAVSPLPLRHPYKQLWDTAGEERFYSLSKSYFRGSQVQQLRAGSANPAEEGCGGCRVLTALPSFPLGVTCVQGVLAVYDVTNRKSFEHVEEWMKALREARIPCAPFALSCALSGCLTACRYADSLPQSAGEDVQVALLGNKCDLVSARVRLIPCLPSLSLSFCALH
jgi:GTPase SAR1 family protein